MPGLKNQMSETEKAETSPTKLKYSKPFAQQYYRVEIYEFF